VSEPIRRRLSESGFYADIEDFSKNYSDGDVVAISYIGARQEADSTFISKATVDEGEGQQSGLAPSSRSKAGEIAGIATASAFALLALFALVATKKRRDRKNAERREASRNIVDEAMFMSDDDDEEMMVVKDEGSVFTEDYTHDETIAPSGTFDSGEDEAGFEVKL